MTMKNKSATMGWRKAAVMIYIVLLIQLACCDDNMGEWIALIF